MTIEQLLQPGPQRKEVTRGVILGILASAAIYFGFFYAPIVTKAKEQE